MTPNRIQVLDPWVAERIAAGEVIERPASVVKELVENSLDAGATEVTVLLEGGGKQLIEVLDNGHGIAPDDLSLSMRRHATSKIQKLEDLEKLHTLGFRGEALASIAAVSELSLLSRARDLSEAYEINSQGELSAKTFGHFLGSPFGTRIQVRGLFSQIPARLKFLKAQAAEVSQVREWLERLALANPKVGFRLLSDRRPILTLRPQEESERVRAVLSDGGDYPMISATSDLGFRERLPGSLHVRIHWLQGMSLPHSRKLAQTVNGRAVRDRVLQQAFLGPFRQALLPGQFPALALFVEIDPSQLDVNVHPTKTEIRFLESRRVFQEIQALAESLIEKKGAPAWVPGPSWQASEKPFGTFQIPSSQPSFDLPPVSRSVDPAPLSQNSQTEPPPTHFLESARFVGTLFKTYLVFDAGQEMVLLDQHAAHERIRYEKLKRSVFRSELSPSQALLLPEAVHFGPELKPVLLERLKWLEKLGFEVEIFSEISVLFRGIPVEWGQDLLRVRLKNLVDRVLAESEDTATGTLSPDLKMDEALFERLASEACHSAIRAGDTLDRTEALELVRMLFQCEHPWNCPHGRPTTARLPIGRFEEWFHRRI